MRTLIINGSPKGKNGNTEWFVRHFNSGFKEPCKVCYAAKESGAHLASYIRHFDTGLVSLMTRPLTLSKAKRGLLQLMFRIGLGDSMYWNHMLKSSKAFDKRFDRPFERRLTYDA